MAAVELVADRETKAEFPTEEKVGDRVRAPAERRGIATRMRGDVFNFAPCYVTEPSQIDQMVSILGDSIDEVLGS